MDIVINDNILPDDFFRWLVLYRPFSEFRVGGFSLRERLERLVGRESIYLLLKNDLQARILSRRLGIAVQTIPENDFIMINSRVAGSFTALEELIKYLETAPSGKAIYIDGVFIAGKLNKDNLDGFNLANKLPGLEYPSTNIFLVRYPWDIIKIQGMIISDDIFSKFIKGNFSVLKPNRGQWPVFASKEGVYIEKYVYLDSSKGPIIIGDNVEVHAFSRISGPSVIRENSYIFSGLVRENVVIGPVCKIGGEISDSLVDGYTNKAHESYLGHSYVGEWVNIGALSVTSDLKNTYGKIKVEFGGVRFDTGTIKLGSFIGDFAKISISTSIFAGKIIGAFSHVMGLVYRNIPPFTMWNGYTRKIYQLNLSSAIRTQERMYSRRDIQQLEEEREYIEKLFEGTSQDRAEAYEGSFEV
jgi:UDP-N-acetylglucosamine diphosphorylase/glucosamine-1-phosphate N-acetyltransferase